MGNLNLEIIAQLILVTLILLAGPAVVFLLSIRKGNL